MQRGPRQFADRTNPRVSTFLRRTPEERRKQSSLPSDDVLYSDAVAPAGGRLYLSNELARAWESTRAFEETKAGPEEAQTLPEGESLLHKNRHRKYFSLALQKTATSDCWDGMAIGYRQPLDSAVEPVFSVIPSAR